MRLLVVLLAEKVIIDSRTNSITAINLIETISSVTFPHWVASPFIMASFERENGDLAESEGTLTFMIDDEEFVRTSFIVEFGDMPRARSIIELNGMLVPRPGHLKICISVAGEKRGEWDMLVSQIREEKSDRVETNVSASALPPSPRPRTAASRAKSAKEKAT